MMLQWILKATKHRVVRGWILEMLGIREVLLVVGGGCCFQFQVPATRCPPRNCLFLNERRRKPWGWHFQFPFKYLEFIWCFWEKITYYPSCGRKTRNKSQQTHATYNGPQNPALLKKIPLRTSQGRKHLSLMLVKFLSLCAARTGWKLIKTGRLDVFF